MSKQSPARTRSAAFDGAFIAWWMFATRYNEVADVIESRNSDSQRRVQMQLAHGM